MPQRRLVAALLSLLLATSASAAPRYRLVPLPTLPGTHVTFAYAIGANGAIVGSSGEGVTSSAVTWTPDGAGGYTVQDIGLLPGGTQGAGLAISAGGTVVGSSNTSVAPPRATLWRDGAPLDLERGADGSANLYALGVNSAGLISGSRTGSGSGNVKSWRAVMWEEDANHPGRFNRTILPLPFGADSNGWTFGVGMNESGRILGRTARFLFDVPHPILWDNDAARTPTEILPPADAVDCLPEALNDAGHVVGTLYQSFGYSLGALWSADPAHTLTPLAPLVGDNASTALGVDPTGAIVTGSSFTYSFPAGPSAYHAELWENGVPIDLAAATDASGAGWTLEQAHVVGADGVVVVIGQFGGFSRVAALVPLPTAGAPRAALGGGLALARPMPNPMRASTRLRFTLPSAGRAQLVLFDIGGRRVATLVDDALPAGAHDRVWDGRDASGRAVGAGLYLARLTSEGTSVVQRVMLAR